MSRPQNQPRDLGGPLIIIGGLAWLYWEPAVLGSLPQDWRGPVLIVMVVLGGINALRAAVALFGFAAEFSRYVRAKIPTDAYGAAAWLSVREARRAGMFAGRGFFIGADRGRVFWYDSPAHALLVAPTRAGKTVAGILPQLGLNPGSAIITDIKGELAELTTGYRAQRFGHGIVTLNLPDRLGLERAEYNVCQIVLDSLETRPQDAFGDAKAIAGQLNPSPPGGWRDPYWPGGTEKVITFAILALAVLAPERCHLPEVFVVVSDPALFQTLCEALQDSDVLGGDLATLARSLLGTLTKTPKEFQSFANGAAQALVPYSASGRLGQISKACSFRFHDAKRGRVSIYIGADMSRPDEIKKGPGLWNWAAMTEIQREGSSAPVTMFVDEAYQYKIQNLPAILMGATGYGLKCQLVFQSLASIEEVYGRNGASAILAQCALQQYFGINDWQDAERISKALGQRTEAVASFGMTGAIDERQSAHGRALLTAEEIRRLPADAQLVFTSGNRQAILRKIGYHEIEPLRSRFAANSLYGSARWSGTRKVSISRTAPAGHVTGRLGPALGRRAPIPYGSIALRFVIDFLRLLAGTNRELLVIAVAVVVVSQWGVPHLRYEYSAIGPWQTQRYVSCRYIGLRPFVLRGPDCPLIAFRPIR